jgi:hypothetical protein
MFKKCLTKLNLANRTSKFSKKYFSQTYASLSIDKYPDEFIERLKSPEFTEETWVQFEADVLEKIHFFDSDQYVDLVALATKADKGTELFWDQIARKIYDYELDLPQTIYLAEALDKNSRVPHFIYDPIYRNLLTAKIKWHNGSEAIKKLI